MVTKKKNRLGAPPTIEESLGVLHKAESEMIEQHIRANPTIAELVVGKPEGAVLVAEVDTDKNPKPDSKPEAARPKADEKKIKYKQFNVAVPEDVFFAIKSHAVEQRKSLQTVGIEILSDYVRKKLNRKKEN
jgi:hypothetical protein